MLNKLILSLALASFTGFSQSQFKTETDFIKDSIAFEEVFNKATNSFSEDFEKGKVIFNDVFLELDTLIQEYPDKIYFKKRKADVLNKLSVVDLYAANYTNALHRLNQSIKIRNSYGMPDDAVRAYYLMGIVWVRQNRYEKAKQYYDSAYAMTQRNIAKGLPYHSFKSTILNVYGSHYANLGNLEKAAFYFKKAIRLSDSLGDKNIGAMNRLQYAEVIRDQEKRYKEALELRKQAYQNYVDLGLKNPQMDALSELAISYNDVGNTAKAYTIKKQHIDYLKESGQKLRLLQEYPYYLEILQKNGKFKEGFEIHNEYIALKDSLKNEERYKELADLDAKITYETKKSIDSLTIVSDRKLVEAQQAKKANTRFWSMVMFLLLLTTVITFFYFRNRQKIKEQAYQNILLNNKVATKTEEINELLAETVQHIKSKERIAKNLQKVIEEDGAVSIKSIIADLNASKSDDARLLTVKENIEKVNYDFIKRLSTKFPNLSKTDIEICSFLKMGLDRNQIAQLRNTTIEAVRKSRHRIRKKMHLDDQIDLEHYLTTL